MDCSVQGCMRKVQFLTIRGASGWQTLSLFANVQNSSKKAALAEEIGEPDEHDLARLAAKSIVAHYTANCPSKLPLVTKLLIAQGLM